MAMRWPNGARCAVFMGFDFDAETLWLSRDLDNENRLATMSLGTYGAKVGVPKILELLRQESLPATFFVPGWTAERHTGLVETIARDGHEIGHHGYLHVWPDYKNHAQAEDEVMQGLESLQRTVGARPVGYRSPGGESHQELLDLLQAEGFLYDSSFKDDIVPYRQVNPDGSPGLIELPENPSVDDTVYGLSHLKTPRPIFGREHVLEIWREEFLMTREWGGLFTMVLHPQCTGRPMRMAILRDFIAFTREFDDVWYATGEQIARAFAEQETGA
ncbi:polysaccharide deacetylase family protein [Marinivivus vitaminiproducens]|uniref:polysaccharide deacetylase family protein n=1 Tax=Marinivivus vitaminiproducens TaxID=3035935 RepID=UPI0027AB1226|nr:polysaccharide deacetylase [Geminicoccaceae bacterium SCSIO 64248]